MATVPNVVLTGTAYQNLNTATSIITGTAIVIQNKGTVDVRIIIGPTLPTASSENGWLLAPRSSVVVENETEIVWAKSVALGNTHISVQPFL